MDISFYIFPDAINCLALVYLPYLLREDLNTLIRTSKDDIKSTPHVFVVKKEDILSSKFEIYAEGNVVGLTESLPKAVMIVLATYYTFNIAYPDKGVSTLTFVQKVFANHQDRVKRDTKVIALLSKITD